MDGAKCCKDHFKTFKKINLVLNYLPMIFSIQLLFVLAFIRLSLLEKACDNYNNIYLHFGNVFPMSRLSNHFAVYTANIIVSNLTCNNRKIQNIRVSDDVV